LLRGYEPGQFIGTAYNLLNLEYRFPVALRRPRPQARLPPVSAHRERRSILRLWRRLQQHRPRSPIQSLSHSEPRRRALARTPITDYRLQSNLRLGLGARGSTRKRTVWQSYAVIVSGFLRPGIDWMVTERAVHPATGLRRAQADRAKPPRSAAFFPQKARAAARPRAMAKKFVCAGLRRIADGLHPMPPAGLGGARRTAAGEKQMSLPASAAIDIGRRCDYCCRAQRFPAPTRRCGAADIRIVDVELGGPSACPTRTTRFSRSTYAWMRM